MEYNESIDNHMVIKIERDYTIVIDDHLLRAMLIYSGFKVVKIDYLKSLPAILEY